jgi:hypothetical protein
MCIFNLETPRKPLAPEAETIFIRRSWPLQLSLPADFTASWLLWSGSPPSSPTGSEIEFQGNAWMAGRQDIFYKKQVSEMKMSTCCPSSSFFKIVLSTLK